jgi:hypothetical protein
LWDEAIERMNVKIARYHEESSDLNARKYLSTPAAAIESVAA